MSHYFIVRRKIKLTVIVYGSSYFTSTVRTVLIYESFKYYSINFKSSIN